MNEHKLGPHCPACGGESSRAVRTHCVHVGSESIYYLTYVWACHTCGRQWLDDSLERLNTWAADSARLAVAHAASEL
jgi:transposase-like protein